jgi:type I restriction enzyme, S subunit
LPARDRDGSGHFIVAGSNGVSGYHSKFTVKGPGIVVGRKGSAGKVTWYEDDFWPIDTTYYVRPNVGMELRWIYYLLRHLKLERSQL